MNNGKGIRVAKCQIGQEYCYPSCYFRQGNRCCFKSKHGRQIPELKMKKSDNCFESIITNQGWVTLPRYPALIRSTTTSPIASH